MICGLEFLLTNQNDIYMYFQYLVLEFYIVTDLNHNQKQHGYATC